MNKILAFNADDAYTALTPEECIDAMFAHTDAEGNLAIPKWPYDGNGEAESSSHGEHGEYYLMKMNWNKERKKSVTDDFEALFNALEIIASKWEKLSKTLEKNKEILSKELLAIWNTYVRPFDIGALDMNRIDEIWNKKEMIAFSDDDKISEEKNENFAITDEEERLWQEYIDTIHRDAESRLERKIAAYDVIVRARRTCRLMSLKAPDVVVNNEAKLLAQAMVLNRFCLSYITVEEQERVIE